MVAFVSDPRYCPPQMGKQLRGQSGSRRNPRSIEKVPNNGHLLVQLQQQTSICLPRSSIEVCVRTNKPVMVHFGPA